MHSFPQQWNIEVENDLIEEGDNLHSLLLLFSIITNNIKLVKSSLVLHLTQCCSI